MSKLKEKIVVEMSRPHQEDVGSASSDPDASRGDGAPRYAIPRRELTAVEIPAVVENIDRAVRAFGRVPSLRHVSVEQWLIPVCFLLSICLFTLGPRSSEELHTTVYKSRGAFLPAHHVT